MRQWSSQDQRETDETLRMREMMVRLRKGERVKIYYFCSPKVYQDFCFFFSSLNFRKLNSHPEGVFGKGICVILFEYFLYIYE